MVSQMRVGSLKLTIFASFAHYIFRTFTYMYKATIIMHMSMHHRLQLSYAYNVSVLAYNNTFILLKNKL